MLPTLTAVKVMLYQGMREQGIGKAELARRLGWHLPQVDRILDVQHKSRMDQVDAAMGAIAGRVKTPSQRGTDPRIVIPAKAGIQEGWSGETPL